GGGDKSCHGGDYRSNRDSQPCFAKFGHILLLSLSCGMTYGQVWGSLRNNPLMLFFTGGRLFSRYLNL
ncbi:hypothetical protein AZ027_005011, partial [Klebsiella pneumoniae]|uniref:hypothetical protein n=1 Tax=Klebsiella pneumoniae TaxID=573 RepID=UPI000B69DEB0